MINDTIHSTLLNETLREIHCCIEVWDNDFNTTYFWHNHTVIKEFKVDRIGESKFFGFGVIHKITIKILDKNRAFNVLPGNKLFLDFSTRKRDDLYVYPTFHVSEITRDEKSNELTIVAYDALNWADKHTTAELVDLNETYTLGEFALACADLLNAEDKWINEVKFINVDAATITTTFTGNFEGTENIREALNDVAEATQTIFYVDCEDNLIFKGLDKDGDAVLTVDKSKYFKLDSKTSRSLHRIVSTTELGNNIGATTLNPGATQYIRDNAFWELRDDVNDLVTNAINFIGDLTINQFTCEWRGNYLVEIGDKLAFTTKDDNVVYSFLLNDSLTFKGGLKQSTSWSYTDNESETEAAPAILGDAIKQTYSKVDKINKEISLVVSEQDAQRSDITALQLNTEGINASVQNVEKALKESTETLSGNIETLTQRVDMSMTATDVSIAIQSELENGTKKVVTETGFTFDETGLTIDKTGSEMKTTITEDGMTVYKNDEAMLTANNQGVNATNLHATTYLSIGVNSRFEDYQGNRTACFYIGG